MDIKYMLMILVAAVFFVTVFAGSKQVSYAEGGDIAIDEQNFPDNNFRSWLLSPYNINGFGADGMLSAEDIAAITEIDVIGKNIINLTGIGYFTNLERFNCSQNKLAILPALPAGLKELSCSSTYPLSRLPELPAGLTALDCSNSNVKTLPELPKTLKTLLCYQNALKGLPELPDGLTELNCHRSGLASLPELPDSLQELFCNSNKLQSLPELPTSLIELSCSDNQLTVLPALPDRDGALKYVDCSYNQLTILPALPSGIVRLNCQNNQLTMLTALPDRLWQLSCGNNQLTALPELPDGLDGLSCEDNRLTSLPTLPQAIERLDCGNNQLAELPAPPSSLVSLYCAGNPMTTLPALQEGLETLDCANMQLTELAALPDSLEGLYCADNRLTSITMLPTNLQVLNCARNRLTKLGGLPEKLTNLDCSDNGLTAIELNGLAAYRAINVCHNNLHSKTAVVGQKIEWNEKSFCYTPQNEAADNSGEGQLFSDVKDDAEFYEAVWYVVINGLMHGTGMNTFSPDSPITRGMAVTVLGRLAGIDTAKYANTHFEDVDGNLYYAPYIGWATETGIARGIGDNRFVPDNTISRQNLAVILNNYADKMGITLPELNQKIIRETAPYGAGVFIRMESRAVVFMDDEAIAPYARDAVVNLARSLILVGKPVAFDKNEPIRIEYYPENESFRFDPDGWVTRADFATILKRFCVNTKSGPR